MALGAMTCSIPIQTWTERAETAWYYRKGKFLFGLVYPDFGVVPWGAALGKPGTLAHVDGSHGRHPEATPNLKDPSEPTLTVR